MNELKFPSFKKEGCYVYWTLHIFYFSKIDIFAYGLEKNNFEFLLRAVTW